MMWLDLFNPIGVRIFVMWPGGISYIVSYCVNRFVNDF